MDSAASRPEGQAKRHYSVGEEIANSITHGIGLLIGIVTLTLLIVFAARYGDGRHLAGGVVFGTTLVLLYTASTLYHSFPWPRVKRLFKVFDHAGIYLLIAGTYTPFTLVTLKDSGGWWLFGLVWALATAGIVLEVLWAGRPRWLSVPVYLGMGWLVVFAFRPLAAELGSTGLWLLLAGGLSYTAGTVFYALKRAPYMHAVWHVFVLGGSVCHVLAVIVGVMPIR